MNSRNSVNETNLVNFSAELSTLNQLDAKDGLLSFPFDHIYACHSQSLDRRQPLQLEKEVEVSTHCVVGEEKNISVSTPDVSRLSDQLNVTEGQNRKLKELLIYHLDLIQQQNELITKRDKLYQALKQENDTLKAKLIRMDRRGGLSHRHLANSLLPPPTATVTSSILTNDQGEPEETKLLFGIARTTIDPASIPEVPKFMSSDLKPPTLNCDYKMIDNKRSLVKKEPKNEKRADSMYTVTSNSGNPIIQRIQRNRRRTSGIGSLSRIPKTPKTNLPETVTSNKNKTTDPDPTYGRTYSVNKKSKMINTYSKSRSSTMPKKTLQYTGSLSDRLQLIDTTPTGEDPYQLGEADMREQSPIPKLMLQKTNHGRMKICTESSESRRKYDRSESKTKINRFMSAYDQVKKDEDTSMLIGEPDIELIKSEPDIDWRLYTENLGENDTGLCDFSFGESASNQMLPSLDANEFQELFTSDAALNLDNLNQLDYPTEKLVPEKTKKRGARTTSLVGPGEEEGVESKRGNPSQRGRKRAFSATGLGKQALKAASKPKAVKGKAAARGKKSPVPSLMTDKPYHTLVCDPDLSWYLGLDQELKLEDVDPPAESQASTVEVPRWREKPYTSCYTLEGTENVDDKVFEKRHQKLEAEERRQLRWHMRRIREQRHVERLRLRQRDSWNSTVHTPSVYTVWPRPYDARFIEITNDLPVTGFGEPMPQLPQSDFMLPWVRTSKALKRSKRSKTHS